MSIISLLFKISCKLPPNCLITSSVLALSNKQSNSVIKSQSICSCELLSNCSSNNKAPLLATISFFSLSIKCPSIITTI